MSAKQLIEEAIKKLEQAQDVIASGLTDNTPTLEYLTANQRHYEITKAIAELRHQTTKL